MTTHARARLGTWMLVLTAATGLAGAGLTATGPQAATGRPADARPLFNGKTLDGWRGYKKPDAIDSRWRAIDGMVCAGHIDGRDTHGARDIITSETFDQFDLAWQWRVMEGGNSGLKYFVLEDMDAAIGHEYQMIDDERHADAKIGPHRQTAALYDVIPASNRPMRPAGQWNESRVFVSGNTVQHWLNGTQVLQYELGSDALRQAIALSKFKTVPRFGTRQKAHILLQDHGDEVCFRSVTIRPGR